MSSIYSYQLTLLLDSGGIVKRSGMVAANSLIDATNKLNEWYDNINSLNIHHISCGPLELEADTWEKVFG